MLEQFVNEEIISIYLELNTPWHYHTLIMKLIIAATAVYFALSIESVDILFHISITNDESRK